MNESTRAYIYRVATAVAAILVAYGLLSEAEVAQWLLLVAALLGAGEGVLAIKNTSTKKE